jgi:hypothetical protein
MFCNICQKFNYTSADCFKNPANQLQTIGKAMESEIQEGVADKDMHEVGV